jgi:hypothetical protein
MADVALRYVSNPAFSEGSPKIDQDKSGNFWLWFVMMKGVFAGDAATTGKGAYVKSKDPGLLIF